MKKIVLTLLLAVSALSFGEDHKNDILEDRIENQIQLELRNNITADYDVDIYRNMANVEIDLKSSVKNKEEYNLIGQKVASIVREETGITDISVSIEKDHHFKETIVDNIIYTTNYPSIWLSSSYQEDLMVKLSDHFIYKMHIDDNLAIEVLNEYISFIERSHKVATKLTTTNGQEKIASLSNQEKVLKKKLVTMLKSQKNFDEFGQFVKNHYLNHSNRM